MKNTLSFASALALGLLATPGTSADTPKRAGYTRNVAIVVYEGVEILDFGGPTEVLASASGYANQTGEPGLHVYTVSKTTSPLRSQGIVTIVPEFSIQNAPRPDILVVPGGNSGSVWKDPEFLAWVKTAAEGSEVTLTVCTGAFILGRAGLLESKEITTWYGALENLRTSFPKSTVQPGRRFIDNGKFITTAGVSAGIDGSLHLVARLFGRVVADQTARYMEYHWTPEAYLSTKYALLNPSTTDRGRSLQLAEIHREEGDFEGAMRELRALVAKDPADGIAWYRLGLTQVGAKDRRGATGSFLKAAGDPKLRGDAYYNIACAEALEKRTTESIEALKKAVEAGFKSKGQLEGDPDLASVRSDPRFAAILASM
jgi:transcriptional regulator GlxA family with amidase domain